MNRERERRRGTRDNRETKRKRDYREEEKGQEEEEEEGRKRETYLPVSIVQYSPQHYYTNNKGLYYRPWPSAILSLIGNQQQRTPMDYIVHDDQFLHYHYTQQQHS